MAIEKQINIVVKETGMEKVNQSIQQLETAVEQTEQATKSFKTQMREANEQVRLMSQKFGETSKEAVQAAKKVADLKDQMEFANQLVNRFNPDQKFKALGAATQLAGTGLQGVTAGMALFGDQSEETEKALLQVQSAMAFSDAISNLSNMGDQWADLKTTVKDSTIAQKVYTASTGAAAMVQKAFTGSVATTTTGFKLLRGAIIATGIGALVVGIGLLIANFDKVKQVVLNFVPGLAKVGDTIMGIVNSITDFIGVTSEAGRAIDKQKDLAEKSLKQNEAYLKKNEHKLSEARKREIELANEHFQRIIDGEMTKEESLKILREKGNIDKQKADDEANKKALEKKKEANEKIAEANKIADEKEKARRQKAFENEKNFVAEQLKNEKLSIDEKRKIVIDSKELSYADQQKFLEELHNQEIDAEKEHKKNINDLNKKYDDEKAQRLADTAVEKEDLDYENRKKEIELIAETELEKQTLMEKLNVEHLDRMGIAKKTDREKELEAEKEFKAKLEDVENAYQDAKRNALDTGLGILQEFAGKNKSIALSILALQKGTAIADVIIGASKSLATQSAALAQANTAALATPQAIATSGASAVPVIAANTALYAKGALTTKITAATSIASILAAGISGAKNITSSGGSSGGSGGGSASAPQAPSFNLVQGTGTNQIAESIGKKAPVKAYVVSKDVTTGQSMDRNIVESASL